MDNINCHVHTCRMQHSTLGDVERIISKEFVDELYVIHPLTHTLSHKHLI